MAIPINRIPDVDANGMSSNGGSNTTDQGKNQQEVSANSAYTSIDFGAGNGNGSSTLRDSDGGMALSASVSSFSSTSSRNTSSTIINNAKSMLFTQRSPRILQMYLVIVFGVLVAFMIVCSVNFVIYTQKKNTVDLKI